VKTLAPWMAFLALVVAAPAAAQHRIDEWTVVGLRSEVEPPLAEEVATLRGALNLELSARGSGVVQDEPFTLLRLGTPDRDLRSIRDAIDAAELYYFQLELELARTHLEQALAELAHASGINKAWDRTRFARMLLGMVHLAGRSPDARIRAEEQFAAIARLQPTWTPSASSYPEEVLELYAEVRRRIEETERGLLRISCDPACPGGHVFSDAYPIGTPGEAVPLAPGLYRIVVADRFDNPERSVAKEIEIRAGEETRLEIDLASQDRLAVEPGPVVLAPREEEARRRVAAQVARRAETEWSLVLQRGSGGATLGWVVDGEGVIRREVQIPPGDKEPLLALAHRALATDLVPVPAPASASAAPADAAAETQVEAPPPAPSGLWSVSKWSSTGAAVVAAAAGIYLRIDAADREEALQRKLAAWGGVVPTGEAARAARTEAGAIATRSDWGTGLLVGAGVLGATAATLFLLESDAPEPVIRW